MEKTMKKQSGRPPKTVANVASVKEVIQAKEPIKEVELEKTIEKTMEVKQTIKREIPKFSLDELVRVISLRNNKLTYVSKSQIGYQLEWDEYGSEQWIEYRELMSMKNSQTAFFKKNWILCDYDVLQSLRVDQYYKDMIDLENIDSIFNLTPEEIEQVISVSSVGIKQIILDKALEFYKSERLYDSRIIKMLKDKFDYDLELVK